MNARVISDHEQMPIHLSTIYNLRFVFVLGFVSVSFFFRFVWIFLHESDAMNSSSSLPNKCATRLHFVVVLLIFLLLGEKKQNQLRLSSRRE